MNDSSPVQTGHSKKSPIPSSHLEHPYIHQCTDGLELEQIYKELKDRQGGSPAILVQFTLDRIRSILPDSPLLRLNPNETDKSTVNIQSIPSASVIHNGIVPSSQDEWKRFQDTISNEFDSDEEKLSTENQSYELNKRLHLAAQHRLNADAALKLNHYQQSIDLYTKSITLDQNLAAYLNRAIAYHRLNNIDAAIDDYSYVISIDSKNIDALMQRAQCYLAKEQYPQAKQDLDLLLIINPENAEIEDLMNTLISLQKTEIRPAIISHNHEDNSMTIDHHPPQENSPSDFDHQNIHQFHISSSHDDDDEMALGDEASAPGLEDNLSDDEGHVSRNFNVSPTIDEDADTHVITTQKPFNDSIDQNIVFQIDENKQQPITTISDHQQTNENDENDLYDHPSHSSSQRNNTLKNNNQMYSQNSSNYDAITNSNFGLLVQSWLRDLVTLQSNRRYYDRPWSRSSRPWSLDKIQQDIDRFHRFYDHRNAIDVSKKMLRNGILDYHHHAEFLVETLTGCAECYSKLQDHPHAIQYATEALQYNRNEAGALTYRGKAFGNEKFLLFSYDDYARVPSNDFNSHLAQRACEKLTIELNSIEGENWREKLSDDDDDDDERYLIYLKSTTNYSDENSFQWHQTHADQFYLDGCFVLAIRFYTICIELQPETKDIYLKRASCYLKVFEPQKVISDCEMILKEDEDHFLALYSKASALKSSSDYRAYELTLKQCIKLQPTNQIILAEYYTYRHEQIPRKQRRIRTRPIDESQLSYDELEQIRLNKINRNTSIDSNDIREQCSFILHLQSFDILTTKLFEMIINTSRMMIRTEEIYLEEHPASEGPFSYRKFCADILIRLTVLPQIDSVLAMMDDKYRILLEELIGYYSTRFNDVEELNRLKRL